MKITKVQHLPKQNLIITSRWRKNLRPYRCHNVCLCSWLKWNRQQTDNILTILRGRVPFFDINTTQLTGRCFFNCMNKSIIIKSVCQIPYLQTLKHVIQGSLPKDTIKKAQVCGAEAEWQVRLWQALCVLGSLPRRERGAVGGTTATPGPQGTAGSTGLHMRAPLGLWTRHCSGDDPRLTCALHRQ